MCFCLFIFIFILFVRGRPRKTLEETLRKNLRVLGSNGGYNKGLSAMAF